MPTNKETASRISSFLRKIRTTTSAAKVAKALGLVVRFAKSDSAQTTSTNVLRECLRSAAVRSVAFEFIPVRVKVTSEDGAVDDNGDGGVGSAVTAAAKEPTASALHLCASGGPVTNAGAAAVRKVLREVAEIASERPALAPIATVVLAHLAILSRDSFEFAKGVRSLERAIGSGVTKSSAAADAALAAALTASATYGRSDTFVSARAPLNSLAVVFSTVLRPALKSAAAADAAEAGGKSASQVQSNGNMATATPDSKAEGGGKEVSSAMPATGAEGAAAAAVAAAGAGADGESGPQQEGFPFVLAPAEEAAKVRSSLDLDLRL